MTDLVERKLARAERRVEILERMVDDRIRDLYMVDQDLQQANAELGNTQDLMPGALVIVGATGHIIRANHETEELLGFSHLELGGLHVTEIWPAFDSSAHTTQRHEVEWCDRQGTPVPVLVASALQDDGVWSRLVCVAVDLRQRKRDEITRRHSQKLESLGHLAAGVAHEINTPMQFISDNLLTLERGVGGMVKIYEALRAVAEVARRAGVCPDLVDAVDTAERDARWSYFEPRLGRALDRAQQGVKRVSDITRALTRFAHPRNDLDLVDINEAVATTLIVARTELRGIADVQTDLGELPPVRCHSGDINQVLLHLLVNAAHAIADADRTANGQITVRTLAQSGGDIEIEIADNGCGIPDAIRDRIYDPFFTTKEPGRGRGQGLAVAHAVIVERHRGALWFETSAAGTTFHVRLPVDASLQRSSP